MYQLTGDSGPENKGVKNWSEIISAYLLHYLRNQQKPSLAAVKTYQYLSKYLSHTLDLDCRKKSGQASFASIF